MRLRIALKPKWMRRIFNKTRTGLIPESFAYSQKWTLVYRIICKIKGGSLLDVGCGRGELVNLIKQDFKTIVGVDINPRDILFIRKRFRDQDHIALLVNDAYCLGVRKNTFDVVTIIDVLEHLDNPEIALRQAYDVLKPGGKLLVTTPNWYNIFDLLRGVGPRHVQVHSSLGWCKKTKKSGFKILKCRAQWFPIYNVRLFNNDYVLNNFHLFGAGVLILAIKKTNI